MAENDGDALAVLDAWLADMVRRIRSHEFATVLQHFVHRGWVRVYDGPHGVAFIIDAENTNELFQLAGKVTNPTDHALLELSIERKVCFTICSEGGHKDLAYSLVPK